MGELLNLVAKVTFDSNEYDKGIKGLAGKAAKTLGGIAKIGTAAIAAGGAAVVALTKQAIDGYKDYEQLTGGIQTLYGENSKAANDMMQHAAEAWKTSGMSANEYMETAIESSAAMINALGGDTEKAAEMMDMSITDMSDNVNKMGTSMEAVQNAYRGFSRGNFTMLDNLALGFAGTKEGMQQLLDKATEYAAKNGEIRNFSVESYADIVDAIHIVQTEMGITGTTAEEAKKTISGSINSMKSAWSNLVTGLADDNADLGKLIDDLVVSIIGEDGEGGVINNILPAVERALNGIVTVITEVAPKLIPLAVDIIIQHLPKIIEAGTQIIVALIGGLVQALPQLVAAIPQILSAIWNALKDGWPQIKEAGIELLKMLGEGIAAGWNWVKEKLSGVVEKIKNILHFDWSFPKPKLPHFSVNWRDLGIVSIPDISIEWYKKAYDNPYMFTKPTVMGFGDGNGGEMVYGHQSLLNDIKTAMRDTMGSEQPVTIIVQSVLDGKVIGETATKWQRRQARAFG